MASTSEPEKRVEPPLEALRALPEEEKSRLRDEALDELAREEARVLGRRARLVQLGLAVLVFALVFAILRARREQPVETQRGVETR
ncbi:MAG: hypothetical protein ACAI25_16605 [Planctomycetota bacterium]